MVTMTSLMLLKPRFFVSDYSTYRSS